MSVAEERVRVNQVVDAIDNWVRDKVREQDLKRQGGIIVHKFSADVPDEAFLTNMLSSRNMNCLDPATIYEGYPPRSFVQVTLTRAKRDHYIFVRKSHLRPQRPRLSETPTPPKQDVKPADQARTPQKQVPEMASLISQQARRPAVQTKAPPEHVPVTAPATLQHARSSWADVVVCAFGLSQGQLDMVKFLLTDCGSRIVDSPDAATHAVVGDIPLSSDLVKEVRRLRDHMRIVSLSWFDEVLENASPWDDSLLRKHVPEFVRRDVLVEKSPNGIETQQRLADSLSETLDFLKRERPEEIEAGQLRLAVERSLLDSAIQIHTNAKKLEVVESPADVLGVSEDAGLSEVRAAYRAKAMQAHPDKGGDPSAFCRIQRAYLSLHAKLVEPSGPEAKKRKTEHAEQDEPQLLALPAVGECKDFELRSHRELVSQKFRQDGVDLSQCVANQLQAMQELSLEDCDLGATNMNEQGEVIYNQCFYLSLSRSYLGDAAGDKTSATLKETALSMKRVIESAVLATHPDWAGQRVGEDVQAFSDFLFFVLGSKSLLSDLAVAVFDSCSGGVEVYIGRCFPGAGRHAEQRHHLLTVQYVPGHYRALVPLGSSQRPSLRELLSTLKKHSVNVVSTYV